MIEPQQKPSYKIYKGFRIPMGFSVENFASALNYQAQPGDTFIVTYPKCGTTWTQHIVWMLHHDGQPLPVGKNIQLEIPFLEKVGAEFVANLPAPRFIKTHFTYELTPFHHEAKYIYVARNPFDCLVSFYYHTQGFVKLYEFAAGTFEQFFECFIRGEVDGGDYFDHLLAWYEHKADPNVLFLTYEQMKANTRQAIIEIADFLEPEYSSKVKDGEILDRILHHSSFEQMSQNQSRWSSKRSAEMTPFIRKGEVGDWQNHFSETQKARLLEKFIARTAETGIAELWPDLIPRSGNFYSR